MGKEKRKILPYGINFSRFWWIIVLAAFIVYSPTFKADFTNWDDPSLTYNNPLVQEFSLQNLKHIFQIKNSGTYQPLRTFSYLLDHTIAGPKPFLFHLHNLLLFVLNGLLVFLILRHFTNDLGAFLGALLFVVHPIHVEAVAWIAGRKEVLSGAFFFLSFLLYIEFRKNQSTSYYLFSLASFLLSLLSKPSTVVLPFLLALYELIHRKPFRTWWKLVLPFWIPNLLVIFYFIFYAGTSQSHYHGGNLFYILLTESWIILRYIANLIFPWKLNPRYMVYVFKSINLKAIAGILFNLVILFVLFRKARRWKNLRFAGFWFYLAMLPVLNIIPISTLMADRYIYLSSFAYALLFALAGQAAQKRKASWGILIIVIFLLFYGVQTFCYTADWKNSETLWKSTLKRHPDHPLAHNQLGMYYIDQGNTAAGYREFQKAVDALPNYESALFNLCGAAYTLGHYEVAIQSGEKAIALSPEDPLTFYQVGTAYDGLKDYQKALNYLERAILLKPDYKDAYFNMGTVYFHIGDFESALEQYLLIESRWGPEPMLLNNIAAAYYQIGIPQSSLEYYRKYAVLFPQAPGIEFVEQNIEALEKMVGESDNP